MTATIRARNTVRSALTTVLGTALAGGLLAGCGGNDNPIPSAAEQTPVQSRPIGETPEPTPTPAPSSSSDDSDDSDDSDGSAAPATPVPAGVLVRGDGISFRLPGEPERLSQTGKAGSTSIKFDIYRFEGPTEVYTVTRGHYPKVGTLPTLKEAIETSADQAGGKLATTRTFKYKRMPAIEGTISGVTDKGKEVTIFARYIVVDRVMYGLLFLDRGGSAGPTSAFGTFVDSVEFS